MVYYDVAVAVGMFIGILLTGGMIWFIERIEGYKFKQYLSDCKDEKRLDIKKDLDVLFGTYKGLVEKTNTMTFKRKTNKINEFICFLEKYKTN